MIAKVAQPGSKLSERILSKTAHVAIVGLGYVGLPLAIAAATARFKTTGFDVDSSKPEQIRDGHSYIGAVSDQQLIACMCDGFLDATTDFSRLQLADVIVICVPTPLSKNREPDLSFVEKTAEEIARRLRREQLVVLESTTYPGTTTEILRPILEKSGLKAGVDFFVGFSPEREDPGNMKYDTRHIPKIVAGDDPIGARLVMDFYQSIIEKVIPVSSTSTAEAVKILENVFRSVNIALVNELKIIFDAMDIDVWEVIEAASTKPFGFMPFYPGPGLGGHCIPIDPFYLSWKAREYGLNARFVELAGEINVQMPTYVISKLEQELDRSQGLSLGRAKILIVGLAYKKNVADIRESPALKIMELLKRRGTRVSYHDPFVSVIPLTREHQELQGFESTPLSEDILVSFDAVVVVTDHDVVDFSLIVDHARLVIDTRNAFGSRGLKCLNLIKA